MDIIEHAISIIDESVWYELVTIADSLDITVEADLGEPDLRDLLLASVRNSEEAAEAVIDTEI